MTKCISFGNSLESTGNRLFHREWKGKLRGKRSLVSWIDKHCNVCGRFIGHNKRKYCNECYNKYRRMKRKKKASNKKKVE